MHTFFYGVHFGVLPNVQCYGPEFLFIYFFSSCDSVFYLIFVFFFAVVVVVAVLSLVQKWDAFVSQGENKEKRYQLARQSAKRRTASNKSNSNNNMLVWIFVYYTYMQDAYIYTYVHICMCVCVKMNILKTCTGFNCEMLFHNLLGWKLSPVVFHH